MTTESHMLPLSCWSHSQADALHEQGRMPGWNWSCDVRLPVSLRNDQLCQLMKTLKSAHCLSKLLTNRIKFRPTDIQVYSQWTILDVCISKQVSQRMGVAMKFWRCIDPLISRDSRQAQYLTLQSLIRISDTNSDNDFFDGISLQGTFI